uniref:Uncharacterized protein n=1 Tax=Glossina austeni TaxID=7395 RepID=A0A1A9UW70_GLOAU
MLFDAFRMAAAVVVSTPKPLTSLFVFQRLKRLDAASLPESVELSITCNFIKARPYCTCLLKGCVQTILTNDHLLLAAAGTKASWLKQRTRFIFVEFLLSTGVINEHYPLREEICKTCILTFHGRRTTLSIVDPLNLKPMRNIVGNNTFEIEERIIKDFRHFNLSNIKEFVIFIHFDIVENIQTYCHYQILNAVAFVYFELCKYSLLRCNITDHRHRFLEQQIPKICIFAVSKLCCIKSSSILSSSEEGHDIRMHFMWPTIVKKKRIDKHYKLEDNRNNIREIFLVDETKRIIQMLYS